ncbi:hypothetical protein GCM10027176_46910 [Actinoallomurus bryophytorum]
MSTHAAYLEQGTGARDPMDWGPEFSRRTRGVGVYATLRSLGRDGVAELVERTVRLARRLADALAASGRAEIVSCASRCRTGPATRTTSTSLSEETLRSLWERLDELEHALASLTYELSPGVIQGDPQHGNALFDGDRTVLCDWDNITIGQRSGIW